VKVCIKIMIDFLLVSEFAALGSQKVLLVTTCLSQPYKVSSVISKRQG
jgi:hypothetical protein